VYVYVGVGLGSFCGAGQVGGTWGPGVWCGWWVTTADGV
jgi:hypothetical protein